MVLPIMRKSPVIFAFIVSQCTATPLFTNRGVPIPIAPEANLLEVYPHPNPQLIARSPRGPNGWRNHWGSPWENPWGNPWGNPGGHSGGQHHAGEEIVNTIFSGVYPVVNVTWGGKPGEPGQSFISFIDTGSSDTFVVSDKFQCVNITTGAPLDQAACGFGPLYNTAIGKFTNITDLEFSIEYFPELEKLDGSIGYAPITVAGLTVPKQEVALVDFAAWEGDTHTSGLLGLAYPPITSAYLRSNTSKQVEYNPVFTNMVREGIVDHAVFSLALNRVPPGTPVSAPAGLMALGGFLPPKYYEGPITSVPIEVTNGTGNGQLSWYTTTIEFLYGLANGTVVSGGEFQSIVDSGTAPNFVPSGPAKHMNEQFVPPAVYNATLGYWTVDCDAKAPFAAYRIGGKVMPMDPKDMIVRSLNGLIGYEDVCFSAFADGGSPQDTQIIGEVWQHGYAIAFDQGNTMLHFAKRRPY